MPDFGAILRKAREGAVLRGADGAGGATLEKINVLSAHFGQEGGPIVGIAMGPLGPSFDLGPIGPRASLALGPTYGREEAQPEQHIGEAGPSGPTGPSEKQHVHEITIPQVIKPVRMPRPVPDTPQGWCDGLARLDRWTPPCEGFRSGEWEAVHRAVAHFLDHYAAEAAARGWTAIDLFGVHGRAGAARVDSCGALMLPLLMNATALTADAIAFGPLTYRRRPMSEAVLVWEFVGGTA